MTAPKRLDVQTWWRRMRPALQPDEEAAAMTPDECEQKVRARYQAHFPDAEKHVVFPPAYRELLTLLGDHSWGSDRIGSDFVVRSAADLLFHLDWHLGIYDDELEAVRHGGAWIELSAHMSRHWDFLCVDPTVKAYGRVWEAEDAHPWREGRELLGASIELEEWLASWAARSWWRPDDWHLVALTPEAAAELSRARAAGDPSKVLELVIRALDRPTTGARFHDYRAARPREGLVVFDSPEVTALFVEAPTLEGTARDFAARAEAEGHRVLAVLENDV